MKSEYIRLLLQVFALGSLVLLLVPALLVFAFGEGGLSGIGSEKREDTDSSPGKISAPDRIRVWQEAKGKSVTVDFEEYVCRVVASEMPSSFEEEALKAQAIAARTYAMAKVNSFNEKKPLSHTDAPVCDTTHCQVYKTEKALFKSHEKGWEEHGWTKIQDACRKTEGQMLYYGNKLVTQPLFFSSSGGQTENSEDVFVSAYPYLVSVSSPYEEEATHQDEETVLEISDFAEKIKAAYPQQDFGEISQQTIKILSRTSGGRVADMQVGSGSGGVLKGTEVRSVAGLSSSLFSIGFRGTGDDCQLVFISSGSGHGVGLSQYGANGMAKEGHGYQEILQHYYSGTEVR